MLEQHFFFKIYSMLLPGVDAWEFSSRGRYDNCSFKLPLTLDLLLQNVKQKDK